MGTGFIVAHSRPGPVEDVAIDVLSVRRQVPLDSFREVPIVVVGNRHDSWTGANQVRPGI